MTQFSSDSSAARRYAELLELLGVGGLHYVTGNGAGVLAPPSPKTARIPILGRLLGGMQTPAEPMAVGVHEAPFALDKAFQRQRTPPQMIFISLTMPLMTSRLKRSLDRTRAASSSPIHRQILDLLKGLALGGKEDIFYRIALLSGFTPDAVPNMPGEETALCGVEPVPWWVYPQLLWNTWRTASVVSGDINGGISEGHSHPLSLGAPQQVIFHDDTVEMVWGVGEGDEVVHTAFWTVEFNPGRPEEIKHLLPMKVDMLLSFWNIEETIYMASLLRGRSRNPRELEDLNRVLRPLGAERVQRDTPAGFGWNLLSAVRAFVPCRPFPLTTWQSVHDWEWVPLMQTATDSISAEKLGGPVFLGVLDEGNEAGSEGHPYCFNPKHQPTLCVIGPTRVGKTTWAITRAAQISQGFGIVLMSWNEGDKSQRLVREMDGVVLTDGGWQITEPESVADLEDFIKSDQELIKTFFLQQLERWKKGVFRPLCLCPTEDPGARFFAVADAFLNGFLAAWEEFNLWRKKRGEKPLWTSLILDDLGAVASEEDHLVLGKWPNILAGKLWKDICTAVDTRVGKRNVCMMNIVHTKEVFEKQRESLGLGGTHNLDIEFLPGKTPSERHSLARVYDPKQRKENAPDEGLLAVIRVRHPKELTRILDGSSGETSDNEEED